MFITQLHLVNFKRFTDLTIDLGEKSAYKLVLLIGKNGSGKSSVFDAFETQNTLYKTGEFFRKPELDTNIEYYLKDRTQSDKFSFNFWDGNKNFDSGNFPKKLPIENLFYGRSSLRQVPQLTRKVLGQVRFSYEQDSDRPIIYIKRDERFENDLEKITEQILRDVFSAGDNTTSIEKIKKQYIEPINDAFSRIFIDSHNPLFLKTFIPPLDGKVANISFEKGNSEFHYNLLSNGEKEIFNILINLLSRRHLYQDTIYFIDELDLHLNTAVQKNLLQEIVENWLPENCQLWTASHSLGFIEYANETAHSAIIDFDDLNFDVPQVLYPEPKNHLPIYEVAVPKEILWKIFDNKRVFICENQNDQFYNLLAFDKTIFVGVPNSNAVFIKIKNDKKYFGLRDRDFLTDEEIKKIRKHFPNYYILKYYNFENYLFHPENIAELKLKNFDKSAYIQEIIQQKNEKLFPIIADFKSARKTFEELKDDDLKYKSDKEKDAQETLIINDLQSNDFEVFYKFFDMKRKFNKHTIEKLNIKIENLVKTQWFRQQILTIITEK
ncbi:MAG: AAA family ATPase [Microscillaceae bacterium]|jgi:AAA15 family ATPase/GTPase|nr:AAA family ATPase [Microscillaceae bacterium]